MNSFHPATVGALYGVLAQHEQALAQWALAEKLATGTTDGETADRYAAVVGDVKRLIKATEPSGYDASTIGATEEMRRRCALLGDLLSGLTDFKVGSCSISPHYGHGVQINMPLTHKSPELDAREVLREIARRFDLQYDEHRHGKSGTTLHIAATGQIQGIDVVIYELIEAERPFCDTHGVMVDDAGVCPECPAEDAVETDDGGALNDSGRDYAEEAAQRAEAEREGAEELAVEQAEAKYVAGMTTHPGAWEDPAVRRAVRETITESEYDPGDPDYEPGTEAGNCPGCEGWHRPPWCADVDDSDPVGGSQ